MNIFSKVYTFTRFKAFKIGSLNCVCISNSYQFDHCVLIAQKLTWQHFSFSNRPLAVCFTAFLVFYKYRLY